MPTDTRTRILDTALEFFERGDIDASMQAIAKAVGFSRQTLYLNFADREEFFAAVVEHAGKRYHFPEELAKLNDAPNGIAALMAMIDMQARICPIIKHIAYALDLLRHKDAAVAEAWRYRKDATIPQCEMIVARLAADGVLRRDVTFKAAADLVWVLTSFRTWDDLVVTRQWTDAEYQDFVKRTLIGALIMPGDTRTGRA